MWASTPSTLWPSISALGARIGDGRRRAMARHHGELLVARRIVEPVLEQEAIELRLGQRIGALLLDGILGGDDHERRAEHMAAAVDGDRLLLHGLEQGGLGLGRR